MYDAVPAYNEAEALYNGKVKRMFTSKRLRKLLGQAGRHFRVNYARTPVGAIREKTQVQGIFVGTAARAVIDDAWSAIELGLEAKKVHRRDYEFGDAYLIGWSDPDLAGGVSLVAHDPRSFRASYHPANLRKKSHAIREWLE